MSKPEYVNIPIRELEKLEEARLKLFEFLPDEYTSQMGFLEITSQIWVVANTKIWER